MVCIVSMFVFIFNTSMYGTYIGYSHPDFLTDILRIVLLRRAVLALLIRMVVSDAQV